MPIRALGLGRSAARFLNAARLFFIIAVLGATAACNSRGGSVAYDRTDFGKPDAVVAAPLEEYRFGPGDVVSVSVFQVPDLSGDLTVDGKGDVTMPLIGAVSAQNKTAPALARDIEKALAVKYLQSPQVAVVAKTISQKTVTVDGSVTQPGIYPVAGPTSLLKMVAQARGLTQDANPKRVVIFRTIEGKRNAAAFDLQSIRRAEAEDPVVYGDDIIVVDGSSSRSTFRDIIQTVPILSLFRPF